MKHFHVKIIFFLILIHSFNPVFSQAGPQVGRIQVIRDEKGVLWGLKKKPIPPVAENNEPNQQDGSTPQVGANNEGIPYQPINPADPSMAVGPNHIIHLIKA